MAEDDYDKFGPEPQDTMGRAQQPEDLRPVEVPPEAERPPLKERDFIQENYRNNPFPFWIWMALVAALAALFWGGMSWFNQGMDDTVKRNPFLQVTNREISLFLWQFPEFMRGNAPVKEGYLPGFNFRDGKVSIVVGDADKYTSAPPEVLFLYHTWARLLKPEASLRPLSLDQFKEFLEALPEWRPENWKKAPESYKELVSNLNNLSAEDFAKQAPQLPKDVQIAAVGWLNFFKEGEAVDRVSPTFGEMDDFLEGHPHYARNFWRNILLDSRPDYLKTNFSGKFNPKAKVPANEMTGFLQFAYYNAVQAEKGAK